MSKITLGPKGIMYPMPTLLLGANVDGTPNFMAAAACGIANGEPPMFAVAIRPQRYTYKGITQNWTFSVNLPSIGLVKETDYCGIVSGSKVNKAEVCRFEVFYGKLGNAPLIEQCPLGLECKVVHILGLGSHSLVIGTIEETHVSQECLTDGMPDANKIKPLFYSPDGGGQYHGFGEVLGKAFRIGRELKPQK